MPRFSRMVNPEQKTVYHVMSRTALDGFPFKDAEKDEFVNIIKRFSKIYFTDILGFLFTPLNSLKNNVLHLRTTE